MRVNRQFVVAVVSLAVLALVFGLVGTVAPPLADEVKPSESSSYSSSSVAHFTNPPTYDSGWVNIVDKAGRYVTLEHDLNTTDVVVDIAGKQSLVPMSGGYAWSRAYGNTYYDMYGHLYSGDDQGYSMIETSDGGYAIVGDTEDGIHNGQYHMWFVKTDSAGNLLWNKTYTGKSELSWSSDYARSIVQTSDGGYAILGTTNSTYPPGSPADDQADLWLVRTDSAGIVQWNKTYGGSRREYGCSAVQTSDGGYALAGYTTSYGNGYQFWLVKTDSTGVAQWNKTYGGETSETAASMVQTSDGGYAILGEKQPYDTPYRDFWLVKTDSAGNMQWNKTYGGTDSDYPTSVIQTRDEGYALTGNTWSYGVGTPTYSNVWLVKTDSTGTAQWNRTYGGQNLDSGNSVVQAIDGGYAIAGDTWSFGAGGYDFWLLKTDSAGAIEWNQTYGGTNHDRVHALVQTSDRGYAIAGSTNSYGLSTSSLCDFWLVKVEAEMDLEHQHQRYLGGTILNPGWSKTYGGTGDDWSRSLVQTVDGGYALAGYSNSPGGAGDYDFWLVKVDAVGNVQWSKTYGGTSTDKVSSVIQTSDGGYALVGSTYSYGVGGDSWLVKTDAAGNAQWNKTYGGTNSDWGLSVVQTDSGGYALAGTTYSYGISGDFWLVKTDSAGNMQWNKTYGGANYDIANSLVETRDEGYALVGHTESFGVGGDFWLVKVDALGNLQWSERYGGANDDVGNSLVQTGDGGYAIAGETSSYGANFYDFWLVKTDAAGNAQWNKTYGGANYDAATSVVQTVDGGYALAGFYSYGPSGDFWLVKTDAVGNLQWSKTYGGANVDNAYSVVETNDGGYALAGYTYSYGSGGKDFLLTKTDVELGLSTTGLTNNAITLYRGKTDTYWNHVRVRIWTINEPSWIYGDINMDGVVDAKDLYIIGRNYGKTFSLLSLSGIIAVAGIQTVKTKRKRSKQPSYIS